MKKIALNRVSKILSEKEMKNVLGGSGGGDLECSTCTFYEKFSEDGAFACHCNGSYMGDADSRDCCMCYCV